MTTGRKDPCFCYLTTHTCSNGSFKYVQQFPFVDWNTILRRNTKLQLLTEFPSISRSLLSSFVSVYKVLLSIRDRVSFVHISVCLESSKSSNALYESPLGDKPSFHRISSNRSFILSQASGRLDLAHANKTSLYNPISIIGST